MEPGDIPEREERSRFPAEFVAGAVIVLLLGGGLLLLIRATRPHGPAAVDKLPFGSEEQSYAQRIHFSDLQLSESSNLLNQPFTYVTGTISNDGDRTVAGLDVVVEFHDPFNQVILRESQRVIGAAAQPLGGGQGRDFQITLLEKVPSQWNQQYPSIRITGLILE